MAQSEVSHYPMEGGAGAESQTWRWLDPAVTGFTDSAAPARPWATPDAREATQQEWPERWPMVSPSHRAAGAAPTLAVVGNVLAAWRAAERKLGELPDGSPDRQSIQGLAERLRRTYHLLFAERRGDPDGDR